MLGIHAAKIPESKKRLLLIQSFISKISDPKEQPLESDLTDFDTVPPDASGSTTEGARKPETGGHDEKGEND